jgi:hypothetical protein
MVNYDEWFIGEVEKEIAAADRGEFIEHGEVGCIHSPRKYIDPSLRSGLAGLRFAKACASSG